MPRRTLEPERDTAQLDDVGFLHYLATVPAVTAGEGMRAVLLLAGPTSRWATFEEQREELLRIGAIKPAWRLHADDALDKGTLAFMLRAVCRLRRGVNEKLTMAMGFGERRYALKSCIDERLLYYGVTTDPVTGGELLSALTRAEEILDR